MYFVTYRHRTGLMKSLIMFINNISLILNSLPFHSASEIKIKKKLTMARSVHLIQVQLNITTEKKLKSK